MGLTAFSIGRDTQLVVMGPNGRLDLAMSRVLKADSSRARSGQPARWNAVRCRAAKRLGGQLRGRARDVGTGRFHFGDRAEFYSGAGASAWHDVSVYHGNRWFGLDIPV